MARLSERRWTKITRACRAAMGRCEDRDHRDWPDYGGRGIRVHPPWAADFHEFVDQVARLPGAGRRGRSLDRIDNARGYEPGNLRWATLEQQSCNRRTSRHGPPLVVGSEYGRWRVESGPDRRRRYVVGCTGCGRTKLLLRASIVVDGRRSPCKACDRPATQWNPKQFDEIEEWRLLLETEDCRAWYVQCMACHHIRLLQRNALRPYRVTHCLWCKTITGRTSTGAGRTSTSGA